METRRLCKSSTDRALAGVCGGFAEYFGIDSLIVRLVLVLFTLVWGVGLLFYIIAALIMPKEEAVYGRDDIGRYTPSSNSGTYTNNAGTYTEARSADSGVTRETPKAGEFKDVEPLSEAEALAREYEEKSEDSCTTEPSESAEDAEPEAPEDTPKTEGSYSSPNPEPKREAPRQEIPRPQYSSPAAPKRTNSGSLVLGIVLVALGGLYLLRYFVPRFPTAPVVAAAAVVLGLILIVKKK